MAEGVVEGRHPRRIMRMGFAVVRRDGVALTAASEAAAGDVLRVELYDGALGVSVTETADGSGAR